MKGGPSRNRLAPRLRSSRIQAYTLIELLIVVSVLTLLVSVLFPRYQQARNAALIGSQIGELMGLGRACAVINASGAGTTPTSLPPDPDRGGVQITQGCTNANEGATLLASWGTARASGVVCLSSSSAITSSKAKLTVSSGSVMSCSFEN